MEDEKTLKDYQLETQGCEECYGETNPNEETD